MMKALLYPVLIAGAVALAGQASATFIIDPNPGGDCTGNDCFLYLNSAKDASTSTGNVGSQVGPVVDISVDGPSDFANGYANIKPVKGGNLTTLTFTPVNPNGYSDFSFRGQVLVAGQVLDVSVQDNQGNPAQTFMFTIPKANADFTRIGIISNDGETIKSVMVTNSGGFKEVKQIDFSPAVIPEPATWALMMLGVGLSGAMLRRRTRTSVAAG